MAEPAVAFGAAVNPQSLAVILAHGRGRSPEDMIGLAERMALPGLAYVAPPAPDGSWYPERFMASVAANQPHLDLALDRIDSEVRALEALGCRRERIALVGFSQGACLVSEYLYRHPGRWAGLIAFTGGLIGPEDVVWDRVGNLEGTPVLLSSGDADPWVPWERIEATADVLAGLGARVSLKMRQGSEHVVSDEEIAAGRALLAACS